MGCKKTKRNYKRKKTKRNYKSKKTKQTKRKTKKSTLDIYKNLILYYNK